jgi:hypothetical protein
VEKTARKNSQSHFDLILQIFIQVRSSAAARSPQEVKPSLSRLLKNRERNCIVFVSNFLVIEIDTAKKRF